MLIRYVALPLLCLAISLLVSCTPYVGDGTVDGGGWEFQEPPPPDADTLPDVDDVAVDTVDAEPFGPPFDPALWMPRECDGETVMEPVSTEPFVMPSRPSPRDEWTAAEMRSWFPGIDGHAVFGAPELQPGDSLAYDLFSPGGVDVTLSFYRVSR